MHSNRLFLVTLIGMLTFCLAKPEPELCGFKFIANYYATSMCQSSECSEYDCFLFRACVRIDSRDVSRIPIHDIAENNTIYLIALQDQDRDFVRKLASESSHFVRSVGLAKKFLEKFFSHESNLFAVNGDKWASTWRSTEFSVEIKNVEQMMRLDQYEQLLTHAYAIDAKICPKN